MYLIDSNVFIEAKRTYYAFDIAPGFWDSMIDLAANGSIYSLDKVKDELDRGRDDLTDWCNVNFGSAFISSDDPDVIQRYAEIIQWVYSNNNFKDSAKNQFAEVADGWVIATAKAKNHTVVTHESARSRGKVKIPTVCDQFSVRHIDTFAMLRILNVSLVR